MKLTDPLNSKKLKNCELEQSVLMNVFNVFIKIGFTFQY